MKTNYENYTNEQLQDLVIKMWHDIMTSFELYGSMGTISVEEIKAINGILQERILK